MAERVMTGVQDRDCRVRRVAPGAYLLLTFRHEITVVDARTRVVIVPGQEVLSATAWD